MRVGITEIEKLPKGQYNYKSIEKNKKVRQKRTRKSCK